VARTRDDHVAASGECPETKLGHSKNDNGAEMRFIWLLLLCTIFAQPSSAEMVTTTDGRQINLKNDGTYEIVKSPPKGEYQTVDIVDLNLDKQAWLGKKVRVKGTLPIPDDGADEVLFYQHPSMTGVTLSVNVRTVPKFQIREMMKSCSVLCYNVYVWGIFSNRKYGGSLIAAHSVTNIKPGF